MKLTYQYASPDIVTFIDLAMQLATAKATQEMGTF